MKISRKINNIFWFNSSNNLTVKTNGEITTLDNEQLGKIEDAREVFIIENEIIVLNSLNQAFLLKTAIPFLSGQRISLITEKYLLTYEKSTPKTYRIYLNKNKSIIHQQNKPFGRSIFGDLIVNGIGKSELISVKSLVDDYSYTFNLSKLHKYQNGSLNSNFEVMNFFDVHKNILICSLNNGGILLLDLLNKKEKVFLKDAKVRFGIFQSQKNSHIYYGLSHTTFIIIDVDEGSLLKQVNLESELKRIANISESTPNWLSINTSLYENGFFYFYADTNLVGIFDTKKEIIIDTFKLNFNDNKTQLKAGKESLQITDDKIYCLDTSNTVHILEK